MPYTPTIASQLKTSVSLTADPTVGGILRYLPLASAQKHEQDMAQINVVLHITNNLAETIRVRTIRLSVPGSITGEKVFAVDLSIGTGGILNWTQNDLNQEPDYLVVMPERTRTSEPSLHIKLEGDGFARAPEFSLALAPHVSPTTSGCYKFWARGDDLRPDEFWWVNGTSHGNGNPAQMFAYDVAVAAPDRQGYNGTNDLLPGTDGSMNEHYRIWGKPIYAVGDGKVVAFRNDHPTNPVPGQIDMLAQDYWPGGNVVDGNGNFFCIDGGGETVLYAHMQPGSLNRALISTPNASVKAGDFLGLAGNSGASSKPHMHIHAGVTDPSTDPWTGAARPMLFEGLQTLVYTAITGAGDAAIDLWSAIEKQGFAPRDCAVWPLPTPPVPRCVALLTQFALDEQNGQLWIIRGDGTIRTTSARLPCRGAYLDYNPGGVAKGIVVYGSHPHVIGSDQRVLEGRTNGWFPLPNSPLCSRLAVDATNYGQLWALSTEGRVFRYPGLGSWIEAAGDGRGKDICIAAGVVHLIGDSDGCIWKHTGSNWQRLPGNQTAIRLAADSATGELFILTAQGEVRTSSGDGYWHKVTSFDIPGTDSRNDKISYELAVLGGRTYVIGPDKHLWVSSAGFGWQQVRTTRPF